MIQDVDIRPLVGAVHITLVDYGFVLVDKTIHTSHIQIPSLGVSSAYSINSIPNYEVN